MWLENFLYEAPGVEDSASFEVCTYFNQTDANLQNDTTCFTQVFSNYYAYDDGTAERAYGLENAGGKVAMKFATELTDSLLGVYFYFMPIQYLATDQSFILQAWSDAGGQPGTLLTDDLDNFNFSAPRYYANGPNLFVYYEFLKPIEVDQGDFYVGYVQQSDVSLNMGLDKNTSANTTNLFYQLQGSSTWNNSSVQGSVMMRPVFKAALPDWVGIEENAVVTTEIYPNPAANQISFSMKPDFEQYQIRITDLTGRIVKDETIVNSGIVLLDIESLVSSSYLLQITCLADQRTAVKQFIKE
jgi:hypothetical protein